MKLAAFAFCALMALGASGLASAQDEQPAPTVESPTPTTMPETPPTAETVETAPTPEAAAAPEPPTPSVEAAASLPSGITPPPEGKGQVVFFRPNRLVGAALSFTVRENEAPLGRLPNGRYFVHVAEPGIHEYEIGRNDTIRMEIEPGETYYAIQSTQMGIIAGRAVLSPSDAAAFETALPRMRVSEPVED